MRLITVLTLCIVSSTSARSLENSTKLTNNSTSEKSLSSVKGVSPSNKTTQDSIVYRPTFHPQTSFQNGQAFTESKTTVVKSAALVLREGVHRMARFFAMPTIHCKCYLGSSLAINDFNNSLPLDVVCYFARNGYWPNYHQRWSGDVQVMSRQVFELDDNRVRIFCRPQFSRPPVHRPQIHPPFGSVVPGICCRPSGGGGVNPTPATTSTTKFDTETFPPGDYEYYTGEGEGSYTGTDEYGTGTDDYGSDYSRLKVPKKTSTGLKKRKRTTTTTTSTPILKDIKTGKRQSKIKGISTSTTEKPMTGTTSAGKRIKRPIRSLRHKDVVVSFADYSKKRNRNEY